MLVEAGGMVERGPLEALRECMMSGVTAPSWWSRVDLASGKVGNKLRHFKHAPGMCALRPNCRRIAAAQRSAASGAKPGIASFNSIDYDDRLIVASLF